MHHHLLFDAKWILEVDKVKATLQGLPFVMEALLPGFPR